jgi:hypothetical protein
MIIPRQSIIHCHPQEFCVGAVGDKLLLKPIFKLTDTLWTEFIWLKTGTSSRFCNEP